MSDPFKKYLICTPVPKIYTPRQVGLISEVQKVVESLDAEPYRGHKSPKYMALLKILNSLRQEYKESYGERVPDEENERKYYPMPISIKHGSIFDSTAEVLVCPVNCVGVMGKGLALEFKRRHPDECRWYVTACRADCMYPGTVLAESNIRFAATKKHWRNPSQIEWVEQCLIALTEDTGAGLSIAIPQLGCGCGGLDWSDVWPLYEKHLGELNCNVEVWIHE